MSAGGCNCSRSHASRRALHTVYGYGRRPNDPLLSDEPPLVERGVTVLDCDEADAIRASAMVERPDLNWHVEWRLA